MNTADATQTTQQIGDPTDDDIRRSRELAAAAYRRGDVDEAECLIRTILERQPNDVGAINRLGHIHLLRGNLAEAEACWLRLQSLAGGDEDWNAAVLNNLGLICVKRNDLDRAEELHRQALQIEKRRRNLDGMADSYSALGVDLAARGWFDQAEAMHRKALAIERRLQREEGMAPNYASLGLIKKARGDHDGAEELLCQALEIDERLGRPEWIARHYNNLGAVCQQRGDLVRAEERYRQALAINERLGRREGIAIQLGALGSIRHFQRKTAEAREYFTRARDLCAAIGMPHRVKKYQRCLDDMICTPTSPPE
jgi:Flp pilus assembly protein TadD